jgi:hypothetical protein
MALTKIGSSGITSNALTSLAVADGTIQAVDLADSAVTNAKLAGSITSDKITSVSNTAISGLVTTAQLAGSITSDKITSVANTTITGLINTAQIANAAITTALIANNSIITEDIVDRAITAVKIANTAVTAGVYGGSSNSALITVDAQGRITSASNVAASGYSGPQGLQVFNTPGTFTLPPGITSVKVTVVGGGGGGTPAGGEHDGGVGGKGGVGIKVVTGLSAPVAVTVGTGGNVPGGAGNSTTFGPFVTATGGNGGNPAFNNPGNSGNPGASPGSTISSSAAQLFTAGGGGTFYINPVQSLGYLNIGGNGGNRGDGGGPGNTPGGAGGAGRVIVEY